VAGRVQRKSPATVRLAQLADRKVHADSKQPRVRRRVPAELIDLLEAAKKCFLRQLASLVTITDEPEHGVVEPVLIEQDKLPVGGPVSVLRQPDQLLCAGLCDVTRG